LADQVVFLDPNVGLPGRIQRDPAHPEDFSIINNPTNSAEKVYSVKSVSGHHANVSGDAPSSSLPNGKNRTEAIMGSTENVLPANGSVHAFTIEVMFPSTSYIDPDSFGAVHFSQTLSLSTGGPTSLQAGMTADGSNIRMGNTSFFTRSAFDASERGVWHVYTAVIKFATGGAGYVEQWRDGVKVATVTGLTTWIANGDFYFKFGSYRQQDGSSMPTTEVLVRGAKYAPTRAESESFTLLANQDTTAPPAPTFSPNGGTISGSTSVSISDTESGVAIRYNRGSAPADPTGTTGTVYSGPLTVNSTETIKAVAVDAAGNVSPVASAAFTLQASSNVVRPVITLSKGAPLAAGEVKVDWADDPAATSFNGYRGGVLRTSIPAGTSQWIDTGRVTGSTYTYEVEAVGPGGPLKSAAVNITM
jgi:hypothetical protein